MQNSRKCSLFSVLHQKYPFWANLVQKIKIVSLSSNLVRTKTNLNMQNSMVVLSFAVLRLEIPFVAKFDPKNQNCQLKMKFGTQTNLNMQNNVVMISPSVFHRKYLFWGIFGPKIQNWEFKLTLGT